MTLEKAISYPNYALYKVNSKYDSKKNMILPTLTTKSKPNIQWQPD